MLLEIDNINVILPIELADSILGGHSDSWIDIRKIDIIDHDAADLKDTNLGNNAIYFTLELYLVSPGGSEQKINTPGGTYKYVIHLTQEQIDSFKDMNKVVVYFIDQTAGAKTYTMFFAAAGEPMSVTKDGTVYDKIKTVYNEKDKTLTVETDKTGEFILGEESAHFPWWILIVIAAVIVCYIIYKYNKNKKIQQAA